VGFTIKIYFDSCILTKNWIAWASTSSNFTCDKSDGVQASSNKAESNTNYYLDDTTITTNEEFDENFCRFFRDKTGYKLITWSVVQ
jgi:hypothetical protein